MSIEQLKEAADRLQDPQHITRIIANIGAIETDFFIAAGPLSERMMAGIVKTISKVAVAPWQMVPTDMTARITCPDWRMSRGVGTGDAWIELSEITADDENEHSWLAAATGSGPTQLGLELVFRPGLMNFAQTVICNDKAVAAAWEAGFVRDEADARLFLPIKIAAQALAKGMAESDLEKALTPAVKAMEQVIATKPVLDKIVEQVRAAATRK